MGETGARKRRRAGGVLLPAALLSLLALALLAGPAIADPASDLAAAESRAASAEAALAAAEQRHDAARAEQVAASRRARPLAEAARDAKARAGETRADLADRQRQARARIAALEEEQREEEEDHDDEVAMGVGFGLAAMVGAAIALAWGPFRRSPPVVALAGFDRAQALGLCLGGGVLSIVVGAVLGAADGLAAALGAFLFWLGFLLPAALLLARRSIRAEKDDAEPESKRGLPGWVPRAVAALLLLLSLGGLGTAIFSEEPSAEPPPTELSEDADALTSGPGSSRLEEAEAQAGAAEKRAVGPLAEQRAARAALRGATRQLNRAQGRLLDARADARRFSRRLVAQEERQRREAEEVAEEEAEELEELEELEPEEGSGCDPNYSGCVPAYPPDVDCAEVGGSVSVYGSDPHGLDADSDGVGCE